MNLYIKMIYASKPIVIRLDVIKIENGMFSMFPDDTLTNGIELEVNK